MISFIAQRFLQGIFSLFVVSVVVFLFVHLSGDPAALLVVEEASQEDIEEVRAQLGLDRPLPVQYVSFMRNIITGEVIESFIYSQPVMPLVLDALKRTLILAVGALFIGIVVGIPLGILAALHRDSALDIIVRLFAVFGQSMPSFWVAMMLITIFAIRFRVFPVSGIGVKNAVLPIVTLSFFQVSILMRLVRSEMLEVIGHDYIRTARAKGLFESVITIRHALPNAMFPVLTLAGLQMSRLVLGAVVTEPIFAWPGLGFLLVNSVFMRDFPIVVTGAIVAGAMVTLANLMVDVLYGRLDPRVHVT